VRGIFCFMTDTSLQGGGNKTKKTKLPKAAGILLKDYPEPDHRR